MVATGVVLLLVLVGREAVTHIECSYGDRIGKNALFALSATTTPSDTVLAKMDTTMRKTPTS